MYSEPAFQDISFQVHAASFLQKLFNILFSILRMNLKGRILYFFSNVYIGLDSLHPHICCHNCLSCVSSHINSQNRSACMLYFIKVFSSLIWCNALSFVHNKQNRECQFPKESRQEKEKHSLVFLAWIFSGARKTCLVLSLILILHFQIFLKHISLWVLLLFYLLFVFAN